MEFSNGNLKIGKDTLIFNMSSATNCKSRELGLCKVSQKCYAMKSERMYKNVLPYRERQSAAWDQEGPDEIAAQIKGIMERKVKNIIKYVRFNEAGDFKRQLDVSKLREIAKKIPEITFYGYTARCDLDFKNLPDNLVINGSGFMIDNNFEAVDNPDSDMVVCPMDCRDCNLCKEKHNIHIQVATH